MVQLHWPGLTLPHVQPPSFGLRCFDSFTTNRVEQENGNLKEGQTGLKSTSSLAQVMGVTTHRDQKRKGKTLRKSYREEASTPVKPEPILANLYHLLPTTVLVMLEKQCARVDRFRVVSLVREWGWNSEHPRLGVMALVSENEPFDCFVLLAPPLMTRPES